MSNIKHIITSAIFLVALTGCAAIYPIWTKLRAMLIDAAPIIPAL